MAEAYLAQGALDPCEKNIYKAMEFPVESRSPFVSSQIFGIGGEYDYRTWALTNAYSRIEQSLKFLEDEDHPFKIYLFHTMFAILKERDYHVSSINECLEKAQRLTTKYFPYNHKWTALWHNKRSILAFLSGEYESSKGYAEKALSLGEKIWPKNHVHNIRFRIGLALAHTELGQYDLALKELNDALEASIETNNADMKAWVYLWFGNLYRMKSSYKESVFYIQRALQVMKKGKITKDSPRVAETKFFLGLAYQGAGENELAREELNQALLIYRKYFPLWDSRVDSVFKALNALKG